MRGFTELCASPWRTICPLFMLGTLVGLSFSDAGAEPIPQGVPKILGAPSCSSSSCHGGAGTHQNQFEVWSLRDFHSQRPFATLTTARSKQIAAAAGIKNPTEDVRCATCHAPLQTVLPERRPGVRISEGVSCESCHGPAENWLRGHTRTDWSHEDRTAAGMRDLKDLYQRANTCVACHQTVELPLLKAGHPELIFELDGQTVSEPRHWREATNFSGGQAWLVGQAVALRELSWQMGRAGTNDFKLTARWQAALWLMQKSASVASSNVWNFAGEPSTELAATIQKASDELARSAAHRPWTIELSRRTLVALAGTSADFRQPKVARGLQARRAERLVLALDRLQNDLQKKQSRRNGEGELNALFKLAQSIPDFDPAAFASALEKFSQAIN
jgi:hypothetical protein